MSARHRKAEAPRSTTLSTLAGALFLATSQWWLQAATGEEPNADVTQSSLDCNERVRQFSVYANYSWQAVTVRATNRSFTGQCSVYVNVSPGVDGGPSTVGQYDREPPALLLKIDQLLVGPAADATCDGTGNSLNVFTQNNRSGNARYICNVSTVYMWATDPIELYMYITNSSSNVPSYVASFIVVAELINVCRVGSTERQVDSELYAFAPNWRYKGIPPNDANCSNTSYTLTLVASNSSHGLSLTAFAAPQIGSCCSLLLGGNSCVIQCTQSVAPSQRSVLHYACKDCDEDEHSGFTLRAAVNRMATPPAVAATTSEGAASSFAQLLSSSPPSSAPPPSTTERPGSEASSLSSTYLVTSGTDAVPASTVSCSPALTCSFSSSTSSASSSLNIASGETSSSRSSSSSSSNVPLPSTREQPVGESSSLSITDSVTPGTDAVPASAVSCSPSLTCSFSSSASFSGELTKIISSPSSSLNIAGDKTISSSSSSNIPLVVGATVGALVFVSIVVAAATVAAKRRRRRNARSKADTMKDRNIYQPATSPSPQLSPPLVGSNLAYQRDMDVGSADLHIAMVDNDLYVGMQGVC